MNAQGVDERAINVHYYYYQSAGIVDDTIYLNLIVSLRVVLKEIVNNT